MLYSTLVATLFAASAVAVPTKSSCKSPEYQKDYKEHWGNHQWGNDWKNKGGKGPKFEFTSTFEIMAEPGQVIGTNGSPSGGQSGAMGHYVLGLNSKENYICWRITLYGIDPATYQSPARTATHLHQANRGANGPPRIAFTNAVGNKDKAVSIGCQQGPFRTGLNATAPAPPGTDTGTNFTIAMIEANPSNFFVDVHTNVSASTLPGAVRGQLA